MRLFRYLCCFDSLDDLLFHHFVVWGATPHYKKKWLRAASLAIGASVADVRK